MPKFPAVDLSEELASFARAQVAAGRFRSVDEVVRAGVEILKERAEGDESAAGAVWSAYRARNASGPRDLTVAEAAACLSSADPEQRRVLREHLDALFEDMDAGAGQDMDDEGFTAFLDDCVVRAEPRS
jgi:putative addiction module CopG family antidote